MEVIKPAKTIQNKFITIDILTRKIDTNLIPYCISLYDGKKS